jgi:precorrin-6A/cobalt-precorrin-6A reductase
VAATKLVIMGGTIEAAGLARAALARFGDRVEVTTALAGRTERAGPIPGLVRIGGFGGAAGLAAYLAAHRIDRLIDATDPFAVEISAEARLACDETQVRRLVLRRPPWRRHPLDRWIEVDSMAAAARIVGRIGRRVWLTVAAGEVACFAAAPAVHFLVRLAAPPRQRLPLRFYELVVGCGPFTIAEEQHRIERHAIDVLVCKARGGALAEAKIIAARELSLPVVMVRRPVGEPGEAVDSVEAALDWLAGASPFAQEKRL